MSCTSLSFAPWLSSTRALRCRRWCVVTSTPTNAPYFLTTPHIRGPRVAAAGAHDGPDVQSVGRVVWARNVEVPAPARRVRGVVHHVDRAVLESERDDVGALERRRRRGEALLPRDEAAAPRAERLQVRGVCDLERGGQPRPLNGEPGRRLLGGHRGRE